MPDNDALIPAEGGKKVTITIAEKSGGGGAAASAGDSTTQGSDPNTFVIDNGYMILTITIAE